MRYLSIDIETSGLDIEKCDITTIGIILEDTTLQLDFEKIPKLYIGLIHDGLYFEPIAANMNADYIKQLSIIKSGKFNENDNINNIIWVKPIDVVITIQKFLEDNGIKPTYDKFNLNKFKYEITVAGKNFNAFDKLFLEKLYNWNNIIKMHRRVLDPTMYYIDYFYDKELPDLSLCKHRAGLDSTVTHNAIEDAWDVIELLRKKYDK